MTKYRELQEKIAELQRAAEEARVQEIGGAIQQIKSLMQEYDITVEDLDKSPRKKSAKAGKAANIQFRDESGNTWSGRGRMPAWLQGKDKEKFRIA